MSACNKTLNLLRRQSRRLTDSSCLIDDSDEDEMASRGATSSGLTQTIGESFVCDTEEEEDSDHSAEDAQQQSIESEQEDLEFLNSSHRVSILDNSEDSDSETESTSLDKMKRRSIYDNPGPDTDTSILMPARKRAKNVLYSDSESEDQESHTSQSEKRIQNGLASDDDSDQEESTYRHDKKKVYSKILVEEDEEMPSSVSQEDEMNITPNTPRSLNDGSNETNDVLTKDSSNHESSKSPVYDLTNLGATPIKKKISGSPTFNCFGNVSKDSVILLDSSDDDMDQDAGELSQKLQRVNSEDPNDLKKKKENLLQCIDRTQTHLDKLNKFAETVKIDELPDKGEKVFETIEEQKEKLALLKKELAAFVRIQTPIASPLKVKNISMVSNPRATPKKRFDSPSRDQENIHVVPKIKVESARSFDYSPIKSENGRMSKFDSPLNKNQVDDKKVIAVKKEILHSSSPYADRQNGIYQTNQNFVKEDPYSDSCDEDSDEDDFGEYDEEERGYDSYEGNSDYDDFYGRDHQRPTNKSYRKKKSKSASKFWEDRDDFDLRDIPNVPTGNFRTADLGEQALETLYEQQALTHGRLEQLHKSLTTRPSEDHREKDPPGLKIALMPHQQHSLAWMKWRETQTPRGGILADDMGLGKTLSMISLVLATLGEKHGNDSDSDSDDDWISRDKNKRIYGKTLVVCLASVMNQWEIEVKKRCKRGILSTYILHGNNRISEVRKLARFNIVITTYQTLVREYHANSKMYQLEWNRIILDEAHFIRNHKSQASQAVCGLRGRYKWALTGTPIQNKELDLYAILKFLECSPFDDFPVWKRWVDNKNDAGKQRLIALMKSLMLRRTKQELQSKGTFKSLPEKTSEIIEITMDKEEQAVYQKLLLFSRTLFAQFLAQKGHNAGKIEKPTLEMVSQFTKAQREMLDRHEKVDASEILVLILRLRQLCCHPALIHAMLDKEDAEMSGIEVGEDLNSNVLSKLQGMSMHEEDEGVEDFVAEFRFDERVNSNLLTNENPVFDNDRQSSKVRAIIGKIEELLKTGDKIIVVSQWTGFLKVIAKHLENIDDARPSVYTGEIPVKKRQPIVDKFNDPEEDTNILLLSLTAGGVGLNLIGANHLLLIDIHWNPQLENQAQDRIYRFGQRKDVHIYKFICRESIEQRVKFLQDKKLDIANHVLTGTRSMSAKLTIEDLKTLFS